MAQILEQEEEKTTLELEISDFQQFIQTQGYNCEIKNVKELDLNQQGDISKVVFKNAKTGDCIIRIICPLNNLPTDSKGMALMERKDWLNKDLYFSSEYKLIEKYIENVWKTGKYYVDHNFIEKLGSIFLIVRE